MVLCLSPGLCYRMLMLMDPNNLPQPYQPTPAPPQQTSVSFNPGQYDFITSPQKPKKSLLPGTGSSKKQRIAIVSFGFIVLLIVFIVLYGLLTGGSKTNTAQLTKLLQQQTEIARVSDLGEQHAGESNAKNIATSTKMVMTSQSLQLQAALKAQKIKVSNKQILAGKNAQTDQELNTAIANGRFDDAFIQSVRTQLEDYRITLQTTFSGTDSKSLKEILNQDYKDVNLLLEQITGKPQT